MTAFLQLGRGYCEQFAGTFAAMARAVGIPSRVAVGFTPARSIRSIPGCFHVRGRNAHAWPEVFIAGYGWVAFEPTPGRGAPLAEQYTGVAEQQASAEDPQSATTIAPATTVASGSDATPPVVTSTPGQIDDPLGGAGGEASSDPSPWPGRLLRFVGLLFATVALYAVTVPGIFWLRRRRRRAAAVRPADRIDVAWAESVEALEAVGVRAGSMLTNREVAPARGGAVATLAEPLHAAGAGHGSRDLRRRRAGTGRRGPRT